MRGRILVLVIISVLLAGQTRAQRNARTVTTSPANTETGTQYYANPQEPPRAIEFAPGTVTAAQFITGIHRYLGVSAAFTFAEAEAVTDKLGMRHHLLRQYYQGIAMEGLEYRVHEKNGFVVAANGKAVRNITVNTQANLSEAQAYRIAVQAVQAGDTTVQPGRRLIVSRGFTFAPQSFALAYQFDVDVTLVERWRISIDVRTGEVVNQVSLVNTCGHDNHPVPPPYLTGTGYTNFYGQQTIRVERSGTNGSRLVGQTAHGGMIGTYDYSNKSVTPLLYNSPVTVNDITSASTTYTNSAYMKPAISVQWAAEKAFEYYFQRHGRNSFDNQGSQIKSYVHVGVGYDNALWTGSVLAFGDGRVYKPLVELDVVSHELTHGVTQYEAALLYANEPGALNESFSDIMAKAVEFDAFGDTATWQLGAHLQPGGLRDFSNPNVRNQPDTYQGYLWYTGVDDNGGVHYNSGVQNYWFYLLCKGGTGVNDHNVPYTVNAIGMNAAVDIAYRNLTEYLGSASDYLDSRLGSMLAAADLYGKNSAIYQEVDRAWDAVGVIDEPTVATVDPYDITATTAKLRGTLTPRGDTVRYSFEYGVTPAFGQRTAEYTYAGTLQGIVRGLQPSKKYYLRVLATNEHGSTYSTTIEFTTIAQAPLVKIRETTDVTETTATLYGQINPNSLATSYYFEYGPTPSLGLTTATYAAGDTTEYIDVSAPVTGLTPRTGYYYRLVATNGHSSVTTGSVRFFTAARPVITAFTPLTAPVGTTITITGQNFSGTPSTNQVKFGATSAEVLTASRTVLTVKVPPGASLGPITVLDLASGLTAESVREFVPTYNGSFHSSSLQLAFGTNDISILKPFVHDLDGDGRPDIIGGDNRGYKYFQNVHPGDGSAITSGSFISSAMVVPDARSNDISVGDVDGNGLVDVVQKFTGGLRISPNLSVPGYIFFGTPVELLLDYPLRFILRDFDSDGRVDIAYTHYTEGSYWLTILRNHNPVGSLTAENFRPQRVLPLLYEPYSLAAPDLNNDGAPDLVLGSDSGTLQWILRNKSHDGMFAFEEKFTADPTRGRFARYIASDLNADGWKEVILHTPNTESGVAVWENQGTTPQITLSPPVTVFSSADPEDDLKPGDLDGDGKIDLLVGTERRELILLHNETMAGKPFTASSLPRTATWGTAVGETNTVEQRLAINDLNGDGRPDVINSLYYYYGPHDGYIFEIWQNDASLCLDPTQITVQAQITTATLQLPPNSTFEQFEIERYYANGWSEWVKISSTTLSYLSPGTEYKLRMRAACRAGYTAYHYIDFTTDCVNTSLVTLGTPGIDYLTLYAQDLSQYQIEYSPAGQNAWQELPYYYSTLYGLKPGTTYDLRIRGRCAVGSAYRTLQFTTQCPSIASLAVSDITYNGAYVTGITYPAETTVEYSSDNLVWTPIPQDRWLYPLIPGTRYTVRGKVTCAGVNSEYVMREFTTPCPEIYSLMADAVTPTGARLYWYDGSVTDRYLIRYTTAAGATVTTETTDHEFILAGFTPGTYIKFEVAPYCVGNPTYASLGVTTSCYTPTELTVGNVTHSTADLTWSSPFNASPFVIEYTMSGSSLWQTVETDDTHLTLSDLLPGTMYDVRVHIRCQDQEPRAVSARISTLFYNKTVYFPNPTDDRITIHPARNMIGNRFVLYDNIGHRVADGVLMNYTIDLSTLPSGMYLLKIDGEDLMKINKR